MEEKRNIVENLFNAFLIEIIFFLIAQFAVLVSSWRILTIVQLGQPAEIAPVSFWDFILSFALATGFLLFLIRFIKRGFARAWLKIIFILIIFLGGFMFVSLWLGNLWALIILLFLIFLWLKTFNILIHNILMFSGLVGVSSMLSLRMTPSMIILFLVIFSVYDFIAVYQTKHMVKLARAMIDSKAILGIILPSKLSYFKQSLKQVGKGNKFLVLGGGDIIFPLLLTSSLALQGFVRPLIVIFFSALGLFLSFYIFISQKERQPMPALPPIALAAIAGYWISLFF